MDGWTEGCCGMSYWGSIVVVLGWGTYFTTVWRIDGIGFKLGGICFV